MDEKEVGAGIEGLVRTTDLSEKAMCGVRSEKGEGSE